MSLADAARRLIDKHGRHDGVLTRSTAVDTGKPWAPGAAASTVASGLSVVVLDAKTALKPDQLLPEQDAVAYLVSGVEAKNLDVLATRGRAYSVLQAQELAPGETTYLYILHLKGR